MRPALKLISFAALIGSPLLSPAAAEMTQQEFDQLPQEARTMVTQIRASCKELGHEIPDELDAGILFIDLNGDGSRDIVFDSAKVCSYLVPGANCSNQGCHLRIFKYVKPNTWNKIFQELVDPQYFLSLTYEGRFRLLAVSVVGGNDQCKAAPKEPSSQMYCDALVYWRQGRWQWQPIK
jgi:hypothetical protein